MQLERATSPAPGRLSASHDPIVQLIPQRLGEPRGPVARADRRTAMEDEGKHVAPMRPCSDVLLVAHPARLSTSSMIWSAVETAMANASWWDQWKTEARDRVQCLTPPSA